MSTRDYVLKLQNLHNSLIRGLANNSETEMCQAMREMRIVINRCIPLPPPVPVTAVGDSHMPPPVGDMWERIGDANPPVQWPRDRAPPRGERPPCFAGHSPNPCLPKQIDLPNNSPLGDDENYYGGHGDGGF